MLSRGTRCKVNGKLNNRYAGDEVIVIDHIADSTIYVQLDNPPWKSIVVNLKELDVLRNSK